MKSTQVIILLVFISIMIAGILFVIFQESNFSTETNTNNINQEKNGGSECISDADCEVGGCSGELCLNSSQRDNTASICVWKDEYSCYLYDNCNCLNNKCQWQSSNEYQECIDLL